MTTGVREMNAADGLPLAVALLHHFDRPVALADSHGNVVAMNAAFSRQACCPAVAMEDLQVSEGHIQDRRGQIGRAHV